MFRLVNGMFRLLRPFEYLEPETVAEAIGVLSTCGERASVLAGGTDLVLAMRQRKQNPQCIIHLKNLPELEYIRYSPGDGLRIGALATHRSIAGSPVIQAKFGLLATASNKVGTPQIRNMGTIGGNICMAGPSQDTIPPLLALNARLRLVSLEGERIVPVDEFFTAPFKTVLKNSELLTEIHIPDLPRRSGGCYRWLTKMSSVDETLVGVAVLMTMAPADNLCQEIRISLGSVAPTAVRARQAEGLLRGKKIENRLIEQAAWAAVEETSPRSRADYRRQMTGVLVRRAINEVWRQIK